MYFLMNSIHCEVNWNICSFVALPCSFIGHLIDERNPFFLTRLLLVESHSLYVYPVIQGCERSVYKVLLELRYVNIMLWKGEQACSYTYLYINSKASLPQCHLDTFFVHPSGVSPLNQTDNLLSSLNVRCMFQLWVASVSADIKNAIEGQCS